ncbi:NAD-dependent epimerase/dehydratase family protein [Viridibacterium curvum]|uniref:NAD(P)-dependent oxidoreductase n=1 Tax=Viridibacterium curvum TaxID=1101404 RepID=A0ABP9QLI2_9RHOO
MRAPLPQDDLDLVLSLTPDFWRRNRGARWFITGGTGFIGSWLLESILHANRKFNCDMTAVVLSRDPSRAHKQAPHIFTSSAFTLLEGDVQNFAWPAGRFDLCIHAATDVADVGCAADHLTLFESIVQGTRRVVQFAAQAGASNFLLTSSGAVYGAQPADLERIPEEYVGAPDVRNLRSAYGEGKRAAEWFAFANARPDFRVTVARIFALVGPNMPLDGHFAAGNFVRDAIRGESIAIQGDGRSLRSYLYAADACAGLIRILASGRGGQAYNLGSEHAVSIAQLAQCVMEAADCSLPVSIAQVADLQQPAQRYVPATGKAQNELGLAEWTPLSAALKKTIEWNRLQEMS